MKVITHDTTFHADDVFAVAMLKIADFHVELTRTRDPLILADAIAQPHTIVLDVGGVFDPSMYNFDHHQDMSLVSSAGMIWEHFKDSICPVEAQPYFGQFIASIDAIDTNRDNIYAVWNTLPFGFRNTSGIIGGFNRDPTNAEKQLLQFDKAVAFAVSIIENEVISAQMKAESERQYAERSILVNNVAVFEKYNTVWKEKAEHKFAVMPHANGFQVQSRDTSIAIIPETAENFDGFIFRHKSGFMATFKEELQAVRFANTL
jgi:uncharacterized UPF0160 family protein